MSRFHAVKKGESPRFEVMVFPSHGKPAAVLRMRFSLHSAKAWARSRLKEYGAGWASVTCYKRNGLTSYWEWHPDRGWKFITQGEYLCSDCGDVYASGFYDPTELCERHR